MNSTNKKVSPPTKTYLHQQKRTPPTKKLNAKKVFSVQKRMRAVQQLGGIANKKGITLI